MKVVRLGGLWDGKTTHQAGSIYDINHIAPCLDTAQGGGRMPHILIKEIKYESRIILDKKT